MYRIPLPHGEGYINLPIPYSMVGGGIAPPGLRLELGFDENGVDGFHGFFKVTFVYSDNNVQLT